MKTASLWIIRLALTVQFLGVLAVPAIVAAAASPRGMWLALSDSRTSPGEERTIGVLRLRESTLVFTEQVGQVGWQLDLASVKRVAAVNGGRSLLIVSRTGDEYVVSIMAPDPLALSEVEGTPASAEQAGALIERAIQSQTAISR